MLEDSPLIEAIALWEELTGVAPPDEKGFWGSAAGGGTWAIRDTYKALKEALELDPTEVTATLLLKRFLEEYMKGAKTSLDDMLRNPEQAMKQMAAAKKLLDILERPEIISARDNFIDGLRRGLAAYGASERADVKALLDKHDDIAILRRDALRSLKNLRVDQFLEGDSEPAGYNPVYVNDVHLWWNVNSLLKAMTYLPSGVSLNLIRDPNAYESYFAFAVRNGGNLFVLSDVPEHAHPLASTMARKPGRDMDRRAARNWFPYDLLGMEVDEKGDSVQKASSDEKGLVLYQENTIPMMKIGAVGPAECIWITMMLDLIVMKFWKVGFKAKQLSYTGEMIKLQDTLLLAASKANLPAVIDKPLEMPALTIADVTGSAVDPEQVGRMYDEPNRWLEERYKHLVSEESLNLLAGPGEIRKLLAGSEEVKSLGAREDDNHDENGKHIWSTDKRALALRQTTLVVMSGTKFGTPAELEADRRFLARYNAAKQIDMYARREFEERKAEVLKWYEKKVRKNLPELLKWTNAAPIWIEAGVYKGAFNSMSGVGSTVRHIKVSPNAGYGGEERIVHQFIRTLDLTKKGDLWDHAARWGGIQLGDFRSERGGYRTCVLTDARASVEFVFCPSTSDELAALAGVAVKDLPDVLQNWRKMEPYRGNSILDRIDPMIWKLDDPWLSLDLRVRTPLSILGHRRVVKMGAAVPPLLTIVPEGVVENARREHQVALDAALGRSKKVD